MRIEAEGLELRSTPERQLVPVKPSRWVTMKRHPLAERGDVAEFAWGNRQRAITDLYPPVRDAR